MSLKLIVHDQNYALSTFFNLKEGALSKRRRSDKGLTADLKLFNPEAGWGVGVGGLIIIPSWNITAVEMAASISSPSSPHR